MLNKYLFRSRLFVKATLRRFGTFLVKKGNSIFSVYDYRKLVDGTFSVKTVDGLLFHLNPSNYPDQCILLDGAFEKESTYFIKNYCKQGMVCLDVGANFGYYSVLIAKLVQETGSVLSFEPSSIFRSRLIANIQLNNFKNITTFDIGLSDKREILEIYIGSQTATMHWIDGEDGQLSPMKEKIDLETLDNVIKERSISRIDFIKVDIDGHEYRFLQGAIETIRQFKPVILLEVNNMHYWKAGVDIFDFYELVIKLGYNIYRDGDLKNISSLEEFLPNACDYSTSSNIILAPFKHPYFK